MKFILGKKIEMTQCFRPEGTVIPVTVIKAGPCLVTQIKSKEKEGYRAVQIGFGSKKKLNKPLSGHLKGLDKFRYLREFLLPEDSSLLKEFKRGSKLTVDIFKPGDIVKVRGIAKGKGFQGVVKRHGFKGAPATHGTKHDLRKPGSIGATTPQRVLKGKKMAGRMGGGRITVKGLEVIEVQPEKNLLLVKGAVPGARNGLVEVRSEK